MQKSKPEADAAPTAADLRERALRLLARREHSRAELARKLEAAGFDREEIVLLLDEFEAKNWLSDQRFAESWVADHLAKAGSVKMAYELRQRGVPDTVIDAVLGENRDTELQRAHAVWRKKFKSAPADTAEKARQVRFLQSRGFTPDIAHRAIATRPEQDSNPAK